METNEIGVPAPEKQLQYDYQNFPNNVKKDKRFVS